MGVMQGQTEKKATKRTRAHAGEAFFCIFLAFFMVFEIALVSILTVRALSGSEPSRPTAPPVSGPPSVDPPDVTDPIFSGGTLPASLFGTGAALGSEISSQYALLIDAETGEILAGKNAEATLEPASITKVMTLIVAFEKLTAEDLEKRVTATDELYAYVTSGAYKGTDNARFDPADADSVRVIDLLYGVGMESYADCAVMVAGVVCPAATYEESERQFVELMNQKAEALGLTGTRFDNVVGHESEGNYSTAADVARMTAYALQCNEIKAILSRNSIYQFQIDYQRDGEQKQYRFTYYSTLFNLNPEAPSRIKAYEDKYGRFELKSGLVFGGGKTGTLGDSQSGYVYSLVSYVTKGTKTYVIVTGASGVSSGVMKDVKTMADTYIP